MRLPALGRSRRACTRRIGPLDATIPVRPVGQTRQGPWQGLALSVDQQVPAFVALVVLVIWITEVPVGQCGRDAVRLVCVLVWVLTNGYRPGKTRRTRRRL